MADKDKAGPSTSSGEGRIDFASLPPTALDSYIAYYDLARGYPPPPSRRSPSPSLDEDIDGNDDDIGLQKGGSRRGSRVSARNADDSSASSRLRPRSPSSSVAHLFPGNKRAAAIAAMDGITSSDSGNADGSGGIVGTTGTGKGAGEDDDPCPSHFFDVQEADEYLATLAGKHFAAQPQPKEGEVVVQFLYRCKTADKCLKVAS